MDDTALDARRPIEIRLRVPGTPGFTDTSEREARQFGRVSADAVVLLRALVANEGMKLGVVTLNGHAPDGELPPSAFFHLWVSLTGELARREAAPDDIQGAQQITFARKVLTLLQLDEQMRALGEGAEAPGATPDAATPAPPDGRSDGEALSEG